MAARLPVRDLQPSIAGALQAENRLILEAPTGSGKSTQVPQILVEEGFAQNGEIVVLQPRRLAARMLARRVAAERGTALGDEVGYQIRFDRAASARTRVRFVTEGILLRRIMDDPSLPGVAAIVFDEFHERHLYGDLTLARATGIQSTQRPDLKLLVMSATLERSALENYLAPAKTLRSEGRTFPVTVEYLPRTARPEQARLWDLAARELDRMVGEGAQGDALIFMPGAGEIRRTVEAIRHYPALRDRAVFPLYGELPPEVQDAALAPCDRTKIVVATNVAETSLTIDGIRLVVDGGRARVARFDPHRGINTLLVEKISRASAEQRSGRAGRTAPGRCLRLWTEEDHIARPAADVPEIKRLDLAETFLTLKNSGFDELDAFPWLEAPETVARERAERLLQDLGATDRQGRITELGRRMAAFPVHPRYARMLLAGRESGCVREVALIAALTQTRDLLEKRIDPSVRRRREDQLGDQELCDFFTQMRAWHVAARNRFSDETCRRIGVHAGTARHTKRIFTYFQQLAGSPSESAQIEIPFEESEAVRCCVLLGFPDQVARRSSRGTLHCEMTHGRRGTLDRESAVRSAALFVASEVNEVHTAGRSSDVTVRLTLSTAIEESWLESLFPGDCRTENDVRFDPALRRVVGEERRVFRDLLLQAKTTENLPDDTAASLLATEVLEGRCGLKQWDHQVEQWIARLNFLARHMPELELPPIASEDRRALVEQIVHGARGYKEIKDRAVLPTVKSWLSDEQAALVDHYAPPSLTLPNGRKAKLTYSENEPPILAARIQNLYDLKNNLLVAGDRVSVVVHVLAPNQRPVQVTRDIAEFWKTGYPGIKKQLQGRYPKHEWR